MAKKKSTAKKHRERTGTYLSKLTFHVPVSDIIDILAVLLKNDPKQAEAWTDQNSVVSAVAKFLTGKGHEGMKWARQQTGSSELIADEIYNHATALVEKHLGFMIPTEPENFEADKPAATAKSCRSKALKTKPRQHPQGLKWLKKPQ